MRSKQTHNVYLDHASTTPVDGQVQKEMQPYFSEWFGNPSAIYTIGRVGRETMDTAREKIARVFGCMAEEIIFTGSGTESDNLGIMGVARAYHRADPSLNHLVTSKIEHHAVLNPCEHLEKKEDFSVTYLKSDKTGMIDAKQVVDALTKETVLVSIMYANNEIGTVNPIKQIAKVIRDRKKEWNRAPTDPPFFHTDACQAPEYLDINVQRLGVDLMTVNGSKIYGPKGVGALFRRRGIKLEPLVHGGGQEFRLRSGTENVPAIVGFAKALQIASEAREKESARLVKLRDMLLKGIEEHVPRATLNGHRTERLPNNVNVSILDIEGEAMLLYLDSYGISASTGSACDSSSLEPSHVITGLGLPYEYAHGSIRFTLGRATTEKDIVYVLECLQKIVETLRKVSPMRF